MKMLSSRTPSALGLLALAATAGVSHGQCAFSPIALRSATTTWTQQCDGRWSPAGIIDANPRTAWALGDCWAYGDRTSNQTIVVETTPTVELAASSRIRIRIHSGGYSGCCGGGNLTIGAFRLAVTGDNASSFADGKAYFGAVAADWTTLTPDVLTAKACNALGAEVAGAVPTLSLLDGDVILASGANPTYAWYTIEADLPIWNPTGIRLELVDFNGAVTAPVNGLPTGGPGRHANGNLMIIQMTADAAGAGSVQITENPAGATSCPGGETVLSVSSPTAGAAYQWRRDGVDIAGATAASVTVVEASSALYDCVVSTPCASATSSAALVTVCRAEFNCDGFVDVFDYNAFVAAFEAGEPRADHDGNGFIDFFDYIAYLDDFEAGC